MPHAFSVLRYPTCALLNSSSPTFRLYLVAPGFPGPLPDIEPGALQQLQGLQIIARTLTTLPPSWGSHPSVLPALQELSLCMYFAGPLPAAWSGGFRQLQFLTIRHLDSTTMIAPALPLLQNSSDGGIAVLPPDWAAGFPNLLHLDLDGLGIAGSFPRGWITPGFPKLDSL